MSVASRWSMVLLHRSKGAQVCLVYPASLFGSTVILVRPLMTRQRKTPSHEAFGRQRANHHQSSHKLKISHVVSQTAGTEPRGIQARYDLTTSPQQSDMVSRGPSWQMHDAPARE